MNKDFWVNTYNRNIDKLIGICFRYVADHKIAEDLAHDSFLVAMKKSTSFRGKGHFDAWLRKITVNTALQHIRKRKKIKEDQQEAIYHESVQNNDNMPLKYDFTIQEMLEAINKLPEHHQLVFNLYVIDGFSHKQIAEKLNISDGTSKSHLARAKKKLQLILNEKHEEKAYKRSFIFLLFPCGFGKINRLYKNKFSTFKIAPQNKSFMDNIDWNEVKPSSMKNYHNLIKGTKLFGVVAITTGIIIFKSVNNNIYHVSIRPEQEISDTVSNISDSITSDKNALKTEADSVLGAKHTQKSKPVIIKKKRITRKKVFIRDTLTVIDTSKNVK